MLRDELVKALEAQPWNTDVRLRVGKIDVDVTRVDHDPDREAIILEIHPDDLEGAVRAAAAGPWWRQKGPPARDRGTSSLVAVAGQRRTIVRRVIPPLSEQRIILVHFDHAVPHDPGCFVVRRDGYG
ncbi:hypothetical protein [Actinoplanes sp. URMC 104]|uniref:hypothetical protein n=1 Tax=Actinoplanes sp. URMC 104 TaxID=3423409 RepID=UPI003F1DB40A